MPTFKFWIWIAAGLMGLCLAGCQAAPSATRPADTAAPPKTATPAETVFYPPTPTILEQLPEDELLEDELLEDELLERLPFEPEPPLPAGLSLAVYRMNQPVVAEEMGYHQVWQALGPESRWQPAEDRESYAETLLRQNNAALAPFGYRLELSQEPSGEVFTLYQGDQVRLDEIQGCSPVSVNQSRDDFLMLAERSGGELIVVRRPSQTPVAPGSQFSIRYARPQFLGNDILTAQTSPGSTEQTEIVRVFLNDRPVYETGPAQREVHPLLVGLWTYGEHWALEVMGSVVLDGQPANEAFGYQESFEFHQLGGKPLFFYAKDGQLGLNFDGREIALGAREMPHYNCCSGSLINPVSMENRLAFFMHSGPQWYYAELEVQ